MDLSCISEYIKKKISKKRIRNGKKSCPIHTFATSSIAKRNFWSLEAFWGFLGRIWEYFRLILESFWNPEIGRFFFRSQQGGPSWCKLSSGRAPRVILGGFRTARWLPRASRSFPRPPTRPPGASQDWTFGFHSWILGFLEFKTRVLNFKTGL